MIAIGFGGNVGGDDAIIERFGRAREALALIGDDVRSAPLYRSAPIGPAQAAFLNTAIRLRADVTPAQLIATVLEIERLLGRVRGEKWGPRTIDLDILVWGARVIDTPELRVPHPELARRRFALEPVVALLGQTFAIPGVGVAGELLARVRDQQVEQIAERW